MKMKNSKNNSVFTNESQINESAVFQSETVYGALQWNRSVYESKRQGILVAIQHIKYRNEEYRAI